MNELNSHVTDTGWVGGSFEKSSRISCDLSFRSKRSPVIRYLDPSIHCEHSVKVLCAIHVYLAHNAKTCGIRKCRHPDYPGHFCSMRQILHP